MKAIAYQCCPEECVSLYSDNLSKYGLNGQDILDTGEIDLSNQNLSEVPDFVRCFGRAVKCLKLNNNPNLQSIPEWIYMLTNLKCLEMVNCGLVSMPDSIWQLRKLEYFCSDYTGLKFKGCFKEDTIYKEKNSDNNVTFMVDTYVFNDNYISGLYKTILKKDLVTSKMNKCFGKLVTNDDYNHYHDIGKSIVTGSYERYNNYDDGAIVEDKKLRLTFYGEDVYAHIGTLYSDGDDLYSVYKNNSQDIPGYDYDKNKDKDIPKCNHTYPFGSDAIYPSSGHPGCSNKDSSVSTELGDNKFCFSCNLVHSVMLQLGENAQILLFLDKLSKKELQLLNLKYLTLAKARDNMTFGGLRYLSGLIYIDFSYNNLYSVPDAFEYLTKLEYVILTGNKILDLPDWLVQLDLKILDVSEQDENFVMDINRFFE